MRRFLVALAFATAIAAAFAFPVDAAPAPFARPVPANRPLASPESQWCGVWQDSHQPQWTMWLMPGGAYFASHTSGNAYVGTWKIGRDEDGTPGWIVAREYRQGASPDAACNMCMPFARLTRTTEP